MLRRCVMEIFKACHPYILYTLIETYTEIHRTQTRIYKKRKRKKKYSYTFRIQIEEIYTNFSYESIQHPIFTFARVFARVSSRMPKIRMKKKKKRKISSYIPLSLENRVILLDDFCQIESDLDRARNR